MTTTSTLAVAAIDPQWTDAAERYGTPLFYYSLPALRGQIARIRRAVSDYPVRLLFATMANDRPKIQQTISGEGVGACVNSVRHLERALANGFPLNNIVFTSTGLPVADMAYLQSLGIPVNLDSPSQVRAWCSLRRGSEVGARINAASLVDSPAAADRIGMDLADFERSRQIAHDLGGRVNGVHVYAGTNFQSSREILPILRCIFELVRRHPDLDCLNLGGGIGVDYSHAKDDFDYETYGSTVCSLAQQTARERGRPLTVFFEPGRSLVASSAVFITRVTDVKMLRDMRFVVVDASVSLFPRPFHHPGSWHRVRVLDSPEPATDATIPSVIVGRTTFSKDILGNYDLPASLEVGSLLAFDDAGAYCESMTSRFLGQGEPACLIDEG
jgi:diaminopimelate decarboxylase